MNKKNILLQELHRLSDLYYKAVCGLPSEKIASEMESLLLEYLEKNPQDTEMWFKLIMVEMTITFRDYDRIEKYTTAILEYDKDNILSLLILAESQRAYRGGIKDDIFIRLQDACHTTTDKELLSMIYLAIAWYCKYKDEKEYEQALLKSIDYCSKHAYNYELLGRLYLETGRITEGKKMINCALANTQNIYRENYFSFGITDINEFFNEFFRGTHTIRENLEDLRKLLD